MTVVSLKNINKSLHGVPGLIYYKYERLKNHLVYFKKWLSFFPKKNIKESQNLKDIRALGCLKIDQKFEFEASKFKSIFESLQSDLNNFEPVRVAESDRIERAVDLVSDFEALRHHSNYVSVRDPLRIPEVANFVEKSAIMWEIAEQIIGFSPRLESVNFRKSFANSLPSTDTQLFHQDKNSHMVVKFFLYCTDVDKNSGPFNFIRGSHVKCNWRLQKTHRVPIRKIEEYYDKSAFLECTGPSGSLFVGLTTGLHRGIKPVRADRVMLTITFCD